MCLGPDGMNDTLNILLLNHVEFQYLASRESHIRAKLLKVERRTGIPPLITCAGAKIWAVLFHPCSYSSPLRRGGIERVVRLLLGEQFGFLHIESPPKLQNI